MDGSHWWWPSSAAVEPSRRASNAAAAAATTDACTAPVARANRRGLCALRRALVDGGGLAPPMETQWARENGGQRSTVRHATPWLPCSRRRKLEGGIAPAFASPLLRRRRRWRGFRHPSVGAACSCSPPPPGRRRPPRGSGADRRATTAPVALGRPRRIYGRPRPDRHRRLISRKQWRMGAPTAGGRRQSAAARSARGGAHRKGRAACAWQLWGPRRYVRSRPAAAHHRGGGRRRAAPLTAPALGRCARVPSLDAPRRKRPGAAVVHVTGAPQRECAVVRRAVPPGQLDVEAPAAARAPRLEQQVMGSPRVRHVSC